MRLYAIAVLLALSGCQASSPDPVPTESSDAREALIDQLAPSDRKAFAGDAHVSTAQIASIDLAPLPGEQQLVENRDIHAFAEASLKAFPDVRAVRFRAPPEISGDPETNALYRVGFYAGLAYARFIKLADGSTLFDLLTKCAKPPAPTDSAALDVTKSPIEVFLQFSPRFIGEDGGEVELNALFRRRDNKLFADRQLFSSDLLREPNFMKVHGLRCAR